MYTTEEISRFQSRIAPYVHQTPVMQSRTFNRDTGATVFFKCENFQRMGAFKMRGASNAILELDEKKRANGVITHSSGNFAQAVALSASDYNIPSFIVMPENAPEVKVNAVRGYGGTIYFSGNRAIDREEKVNEIIGSIGATFIHPSNDLAVIQGNSTATTELLEEIKGIDCVVCPVGGGGLLAGTILSAKAFSDTIEVFGAEPSQADDAWRSLRSGKIETNYEANTIADGLRTMLGDVNFPIILGGVKDIVLVSEDEILSALKWVWERMKIIIEPSSAVAVAGVIKHKEYFRNKRVGVILSGGNADIPMLVPKMYKK